jgi:thiamine pyrophosphate-dependent acetolactate synthase large subunit-like protein/nitrite reductase/ring-hydroxylating ferredoxin subunit/CDGSH-type Zn-finger protein
MTKPKIADTRPVPVELKGGETVYWCACGRSASQPFCDGSHAGTGIEPLAFTPEKDDKYFLCQCKRTSKPPFCDGSHKEITKADLDAQEGVECVWYKVAELGDAQEGEVRSVQAGTKSIALTRFDGRYGALDNACPHQGGPLGEGSIECAGKGDCWLRCPWHGWDFHPLTGKSPGGFDDGVPVYPLEERDDGIYVQVRERRERLRTVSDVMVETMVNWGVTHVFGMVGHSNLGLADAIREQEEAGSLTYIGVRHEGAAAFACSGFAKLSGLPAACLSIAGPGATNLLTGLWDAKVDRAPVLALTGQVNTQVFGPGAFQEIDLADAFAAVSAFSQAVLPNSRHAELMTLALKHAVVERDVAHLIFPDEVQVIPAGEQEDPSAPAGRLAQTDIVPAEESLQAAADRIAAAKRPVVIVGYGARERMKDVTALAERLNAPVLTTFKAKGQMPDGHPLAAGVLGRSGTPVASWCMNEADLLLVFGASFSNHTGITPKKPIVQVDFDRMALGKFHAVQIPVWGEIGVTARQLLARLPTNCAGVDQRREIAERRRLWGEETSRRAKRDRGRGVSSAAVFAVLSKVCPDDAVIAVDVGNNTYSFGRYFACKRQSVLMSGYLGSIGFGLPAAMGAWAATQSVPAHKGRKVLAVSGDGGLGQYLAELTTAVKYGMDITHVLVNNNELGKISKEQRAGNWKVWQTSLHNPSFADFAANCGALGLRVESAGDLEEALVDAIAYDGPALVEIMTDPELI